MKLVSLCHAGCVFALSLLRRRGVLVDRRGVTAVEYAIIAGIMVVAIIISLPAIGPELANTFSAVAQKL